MILQSTDENSNVSKVAYLTRQFLENKLRRQIDRWQNISFSSHPTSKIQCQLELNQDYFEWNDSTAIPSTLHNNNRCTSPVPSIQSARSDRSQQVPLYSYAASTTSGRANLSKKPHLTPQPEAGKLLSTAPKIASQHKPTTNTLRSELGMKRIKWIFMESSCCFFLVPAIRQPPADLSSLSPQWRWDGQMIPTDRFDNNEYYSLEDPSKEENNAFVKIYSLKTDPTARLRAQRERMALGKLTSK